MTNRSVRRHRVVPLFLTPCFALPRPSQLAVKRSVSVKAVADSKINTDEVLKTIADKVRAVPDPPRPRSPAVKRGSPIPFSRFSRRVTSAPRDSLTLPRPPRPPIDAVGGH